MTTLTDILSEMVGVAERYCELIERPADDSDEWLESLYKLMPRLHSAVTSLNTHDSGDLQIPGVDRDERFELDSRLRKRRGKRRSRDPDRRAEGSRGAVPGRAQLRDPGVADGRAGGRAAPGRAAAGHPPAAAGRPAGHAAGYRGELHDRRGLRRRHMPDPPTRGLVLGSLRGEPHLLGHLPSSRIAARHRQESFVHL